MKDVFRVLLHAKPAYCLGAEDQSPAAELLLTETAPGTHALALTLNSRGGAQTTLDTPSRVLTLSDRKAVLVAAPPAEAARTALITVSPCPQPYPLATVPTTTAAPTSCKSLTQPPPTPLSKKQQKKLQKQVLLAGYKRAAAERGERGGKGAGRGERGGKGAESGEENAVRAARVVAMPELSGAQLSCPVEHE